MSVRRDEDQGLTTTPENSVTNLRGVGPRVAQRLARLGIQTTQDLLFHLPARYQDRTRTVAIGSLRPGQEAVIVGEVELAQVQFRGRRALVAAISDGTGLAYLRFFHFSNLQQRTLKRGTRVRCFGVARPGPRGVELVHPEYQVLDDDVSDENEEQLTPIYPATEGLGQLSLRKLTSQALAWLAQGGGLPELLPESVLTESKFPDLHEALRFVHRPPAETPMALLEAGSSPAHQRLAFEELLAHHLSLRRLRRQLSVHDAPRLRGGELPDRFLKSLPFTLTTAQQRVVGEVSNDLEQPRPMHRLVQGDVGSGKTVVAALAILRAVEAGHQAVLMAPTELLAEQHLRTFTQWLTPLGIKLTWLSGKLTGAGRRQALETISSHEAQVVIGTHALFQDEVSYANLGLLVIDEQHRFGVHQRLQLRAKGVQGEMRPHQLIMTATPIPRTLAMAAYADLDTSTIDELPPGRLPVETVVVPETRRAEVVRRAEEACNDGAQAYWVCTVIEESETLAAQAAEDMVADLADALPTLRVGLVHGRMPSADKERIMATFEAGELQLLVATTVIEVGVDVPNASLMVIENAERLGLAQLHQLRGRVGRGARKSVCVLLYHGPLGEGARARLGVLRETCDGFEIARRDLELRGPGEVLGTRQTGLLQFKVADLSRDQKLFNRIARIADGLLETYPDSAAAIIRRWVGNTVHYGDV